MDQNPQPRPVGNSFGFAAWRGLTQVMAAPHAHNDIEINFCLAPVTYEAAGRTSVLPAGVPSAFWGATPHQLITLSPEQPLAYATVPLARFLSWRVPTTIKYRLLAGEILCGPEIAAPLGDTIDRWAADLRGRSEARHLAAELEIESLVVRMSEGHFSETRTGADHSSLDLHRAAEMATFISENFASDIRVTDVARSVHLHPNRAAALFRDVFETSVTHYLGQYRVAEAQRLLLTTELSSFAVGAHAGFQSTSSYHANFAQITGSSPAHWRRAHRVEA